MSPLGIQRTLAIILFISPWIFIPGIYKDLFFILAGILLFVSTLDLKKRPKTFQDHHEESNMETPKDA